MRKGGARDGGNDSIGGPALEVLIYLEAADQETSITKMASDMGVYKSTIYRTLATLEARGFVRKNPDTDRYWLGNRLFSLGKSVENHLGIQEVVRPSARKLYEAYHETVNVAILERDHDEVYRSVIVLKEEGGHQMLTVEPAGGRQRGVPFHIGRQVSAGLWTEH